MGPLVVAGVVGDPVSLQEIGCRDSKLLTPSSRQRLDRLVRASCHVEVRTIAPEDVDMERHRRSLNAIEMERFCDIARALEAQGATTIVVDAADVDAARFGRTIAAHVGAEVQSRHRADRDDPCAAAASIVAKVARDAAILGLARRLERQLPMPLGSGYPSDPKTKAFLRAWVDRFGDLPPGIRRSWKTAHDLLAPQQAGLAHFE